MSTLIVVDGPNVVNDVGRYLTKRLTSTGGDPRILAAYLRDFFDTDRLIDASVVNPATRDPVKDLGTVIFHSRKSLGETGKDGYAMDGEAVVSFWCRQGNAKNTSTLLVDIPGGKKGKEIGVDVAIVAYLYDTMSQWESAVLFSNDGDFVPAVWSLRRKGKRIMCSAEAREPVSPLVLACQTFLPWNLEYLNADLAVFGALQPGGLFDTILDIPTIAARSPTVTLDTHFNIRNPTSSYSDSDENLANELLGKAPFVARRENGAIRIMATLDRPGIDKGRAGTLYSMDAITRHADLFVESKWRSKAPLLPGNPPQLSRPGRCLHAVRERPPGDDQEQLGEPLVPKLVEPQEEAQGVGIDEALQDLLLGHDLLHQQTGIGVSEDHGIHGFRQQLVVVDHLCGQLGEIRIYIHEMTVAFAATASKAATATSARRRASRAARTLRSSSSLFAILDRAVRQAGEQAEVFLPERGSPQTGQALGGAFPDSGVSMVGVMAPSFPKAA